MTLAKTNAAMRSGPITEKAAHNSFTNGAILASLHPAHTIEFQWTTSKVVTGAILSNCTGLFSLLPHLFAEVVLLLRSEVANSSGKLGTQGGGLKGGSSLNSGDRSHYIS